MAHAARGSGDRRRGLALYGAVNLAVFALMALGAREVPASVGDDAVVWYLALWEPLWILGGAPFLAAARSTRRPPTLLPDER